MDKVIVGLASIRSRRHALSQTISSLLAQTIKPDMIHVFLNGYKKDEIPKFLKKDNITVYTSEEFGDLGDAGKFFKVDEEKGFYLSADDDLKFPPIYIEYMISGIEKYNRKKVVSLHGSILKEKVNNFYKDREIINFKRRLRKSVNVHLAGTGVTAFHTDTLSLKLSDFPIKNVADVYFGIQAQKQGVGIVVLPHQQRWVGVLPNTSSNSIFHTHIRDEKKVKEVTTLVNSIEKWAIH